jgi:phage I-like protein
MSEPEIVPTEFRLCRAGETVHRRGRFVFTKASADDVMRSHAARMVPILGDFEFESMHDGGLPQVAKLSISDASPEVRTGADGQPELWAAKVQWTKRGREAVQTRAYRYCVPALVLDNDNGRVVRLAALSLTNEPSDPTLEPLLPKE